MTAVDYSKTTATTTKEEPFSFRELVASSADGRNDEQLQPTATATVKAGDGVSLAVHVYEPPSTARNSGSGSGGGNTALVFYHGGGAHAGAGYQHLARGLAREGITVYLPDIRGHGISGGPRGDAPSPEQVWEDVDAVLRFATAKSSSEPRDRVFLGGHSSGGGLVVNYATRFREPSRDADADAVAPIAGYLLVAPELGYNSGTARPDRVDFATANVLAFVANGICGILGHSRAVRFSYPPKLLQDDPGMVGFNTVNMANAITPDDPAKQMTALTTTAANDDDDRHNNHKPPVGLWIGSDDELFVADKVTAFVPTTDGTTNLSTTNHDTSEVLPGKNHLGILVDVHEPIGRWISVLDRPTDRPTAATASTP